MKKESDYKYAIQHSQEEMQNLENNLSFYSKCNEKQRKYIISLMLKGIYDVDVNEFERLK